MNRREFFLLIIVSISALVIIVFCSVLFTCLNNSSSKDTQEEIHVELPVERPPEIPPETEIPEEEHPQPEENTQVRVSYHVQRPLTSLSLTSLSGITSRTGWGVNVSEIDPINYENPDLKILNQMGVDQYIISFLAGEQFYRDADYDKALTEYTISINRNAEFIEAVISRGNTWMKKRDYSRAIDDYTRAIRLDNSKPELYNYRGFARTELASSRNLSNENYIREMNLAIEDFTRAITLNRNYIDALINRSHAYYQTGNFARTIEDCDRIIQLEPGNAIIWNRRGSAWYRREDDDRAIRDFSEAIRLRSDYAVAWYNRGNAWYSKGELERALADINRSLTINPSFTAAHTSKETILQRIGNQ